MPTTAAILPSPTPVAAAATTVLANRSGETAGSESFGAVLARAGTPVIPGTQLSTAERVAARGTLGLAVEEKGDAASEALAGIAAFPLALLQTIPGLLPAVANVETAAASLASATADTTSDAQELATGTVANAAAGAIPTSSASEQTPVAAGSVRLPQVPQNTASIPTAEPPATTRSLAESLPTTPALPELPASPVETPANPVGTGSPLRRFTTIPAQVPLVAGLGQQPVPPELAPTEPGAAPIAAIANVTGPPAVTPVDVGTTFPDRLAALTIQSQVAALQSQAVAPAATVEAPVAPAATVEAPVAPAATVEAPVAPVPEFGPQLSFASVGLFPISSASPQPQPTDVLANRDFAGLNAVKPTEEPAASKIATADTLPTASFGLYLPPTPDAASSTPVATPVATAPTATPAVQISDAVVAHARTLEPGGTTEFRMRLDPPDLGRLQIHLVSSGDRVDGHLVVANEAIRGMIEAQLPELRQRLEAAGVSVQNLDVSTNSQSGGQHPGSERPQTFANFETDPIPPTRPRVRSETRVVAGRLDVTA